MVITPPGRLNMPRWRELWEAREVAYRFGQRDILLRYRQTAIGVVWVLLQPLVSAGIFSIIFGGVAKLPSDLIHYSFQNLGELFAKPGRNFSSRSAKIMYQKGKRAHAFSPALHGMNAFVRKYIFQLGLLAGVDGLTVALSSAMNSYLKYAKLLEYQRDPKVLQAEDFNKVW